MRMDRYWIKLGIGKRDRFWLAVSILFVVILLALRMSSHDGFAGPDRPVWKSAILGAEPINDTAKSAASHSAPTQSVH